MTYAQAKRLLRGALTSDEIYDLVGDQFGTDRVPTWEAQDYLTDLADDLAPVLPALGLLRDGVVQRVHLILSRELGSGWVLWLNRGAFRRAPAIFSSVGPAETMSPTALINWLRDTAIVEVHTDD